MVLKWWFLGSWVLIKAMVVEARFAFPGRKLLVTSLPASEVVERSSYSPWTQRASIEAAPLPQHKHNHERLLFSFCKRYANDDVDSRAVTSSDSRRFLYGYRHMKVQVVIFFGGSCEDPRLRDEAREESKEKRLTSRILCI